MRAPHPAACSAFTPKTDACQDLTWREGAVFLACLQHRPANMAPTYQGMAAAMVLLMRTAALFDCFEGKVSFPFIPQRRQSHTSHSCQGLDYELQYMSLAQTSVGREAS